MVGQIQLLERCVVIFDNAKKAVIHCTQYFLLLRSQMRFLRRIEGVTLFKKVRSSEIQKSRNIEPLLLRIERSQLRWFGHVSRLPQDFPNKFYLPKQMGEDQLDDLALNKTITLRILDGIACDFTQAK